MQSDEDFNVKFVNLVKMYKCLYDKKVPEYRNKDEQEKAWFDIAKETHESGKYDGGSRHICFKFNVWFLCCE